MKSLTSPSLHSIAVIRKSNGLATHRGRGSSFHSLPVNELIPDRTLVNVSAKKEAPVATCAKRPSNLWHRPKLASTPPVAALLICRRMCP